MRGMTAQMGKIIKLNHWWKKYRKGREGGEWPTAPERLKALLRREEAPFRVIPHSEAFTSPELAASIHATGRRGAKVVMVRADERYIMAVLPSHLHLDLDRLAPLIGT